MFLNIHWSWHCFLIIVGSGETSVWWWQISGLGAFATLLVPIQWKITTFSLSLMHLIVASFYYTFPWIISVLQTGFKDTGSHKIWSKMKLVWSIVHPPVFPGCDEMDSLRKRHIKANSICCTYARVFPVILPHNSKRCPELQPTGSVGQCQGSL